MINVKQWMEIPKEVRERIAKDFNLPKTGRLGIAGNKIISDGYTQDDIKKVTLQNLQTLLDASEDDFDGLLAQYILMVQTDMLSNKEVEVIETEGIMYADLNSIEEFIPNTVDSTGIEEFNPNVAVSGDKETYFVTKIKPVTYIQNDKKTKNNRR